MYNLLFGPKEFSNKYLSIGKKNKEALIDHRKNPSQNSKDYLKFMKAKVQRASTTCANEYWTTFYISVQKAAGSRDIKQCIISG